MRPLFVIRSLANPGGGAERVLSDVTAGLVDRGLEVTVATFDAPGAPPFYAFHPDVERVPLALGDPRRSTRPAELARRALGLRGLVVRSRPDVVVGFMHSAYVPLALGLRGLPTPVVASDHSGTQHYRRRPAPERLAVRLAQRRAARVVVPSPGVGVDLGSGAGTSLRVIPNPVARAAPWVGSGRARTVLAVGRLEPEKDHRTLLAAFARIAPARAGWRLEVLGDGPLRGELDALARDLGIADRVAFRGLVTDVDAPMRAAAVLAVPSRYESFGLATAEALARGLPVIGFADCAGTAALVQDGVNGRLVAGPDRVAALAAGLADLIDDASARDRLGRAAPGTVERFAPAVVAARWEDLLHEVATSVASAA